MNDIATIGDNLRDSLDIEIETELKPFKAQFDERKAEAERCKVTNDDEAARAATLAGIFLDIETGTEKKRVDLKEPFLRSGRKVDAAFNALIDSAKQVKRTVLGKIDAYRAEMRRKAEDEQRKLQEEAQKREREAAAAAEAGNHLAAAKLQQQAEQTAQEAATVPNPAAAPIRSQYGQTAFGRKEWKFVVLNRAVLPPIITQHPKVLEAQDAVIKGMVRSGTRNIPGVRIYSEEATSVRR